MALTAHGTPGIQQGGKEGGPNSSRHQKQGPKYCYHFGSAPYSEHRETDPSWMEAGTSHGERGAQGGNDRQPKSPGAPTHAYSSCRLNPSGAPAVAKKHPWKLPHRTACWQGR